MTEIIKVDLPAIDFESYNIGFCDVHQKTQGYSNATGISLMGNLFELRKANKAISKGDSANAIAQDINKQFPVSNNCASLLKSKERITQVIYELNQEILAGHKASTLKDNLTALSQRLLLIKSRLTELGCEEAADQAQLEKDKQDTLAAIKAASADNIAPGTNAKFNKYLIYGIVGIMALAAVVILLKKKKTPAA